jgi:hypothetical protein
MGASNYKLRQFDSFSGTGSSNATKVIQLPKNRGKNGFAFYLQFTNAAACTVDIQVKPVFIAHPKTMPSGFESDYVIPQGVNYTHLIIYQNNTTADFHDIPVTDGATYMCYVEMSADLPWDSILLYITHSSTVAVKMWMAND